MAVTASIPAETTDGVNGVGWIDRQNPEHYTLQLMTLSRRQGGVALIGRQRDGSEYAIYPIQRQGRDLHVLVYGVFSSSQAARERADNLSGELAEIQPWVRRFGTIQGELKRP